jgi:glyoxylase-like metal-dependent hydrolase (beta-lactamase superfamily II)
MEEPFSFNKGILMNRLKRAVGLLLFSGLIASAYAVPPANPAPIAIELYNPGANGIFDVSSEIISGRHDAILVDAQFEHKDAEALVDKIKASGKQLTLVYISHSDPDYYFGLDVIHHAFPHVPIVATPQTVAAIQASKDDKLAFWAPTLKDQAPKAVIVPQPIYSDHFELEGQQIKIMGLNGPDPARTYLWIPSLQTVAGGVLVETGSHVFMADSKTPESRQAWLATLDGIAALNPRTVIPGHFIGPMPAGVEAVQSTANYVRSFDRAAAQASNSAELINAMKLAYPSLGGISSLELGAQVVKNETEWPVRAKNASMTRATTDFGFPARGKIVDITFGTMSFRLTFDKDGHTMSFVSTSGADQGTGETVQYTATRLRPRLYLVYWDEPISGDRVVHVEDYLHHIVYSTIISKTGEVAHLTGKMRISGVAK